MKIDKKTKQIIFIYGILFPIIILLAGTSQGMLIFLTSCVFTASVILTLIGK